MPPIVLNFLNNFKTAAVRWWEHRHSDAAAALAFYSIFSLAPLLFIVLQTAAFIVGGSVAEDQLRATITQFAGDQVANTLAEAIKAASKPINFSTTSFISLLVVLFAASRVVDQLRETLEQIFGKAITRSKRSLVLRSVKGRLTSILLVAGIGIILATSVLLTAITDTVLAEYPDRLPGKLYVARLIKTSVSATFLLALVTLTFRLLPRESPSFKHCGIGAIIATVMLLCLEKMLSYYIAVVGTHSAFAGAFTLILVLFWVYGIMQIVLFGAEIAKAHAKAASPEENAADLSEENISC